MSNEQLRIIELYREWRGVDPESITFLPVSGSYRKYFRIGKQDSIIGVYNEDRTENDAFISFSETFRQFSLPVPLVHAVDPTGQIYLLGDLGDLTLYKYLSEIRKDDHDFPEEAFTVYKKVIQYLPVFQVVSGATIDYSKCYPRYSFDEQSMMWDLNYFKYYFLKLSKIPFDEQKLEDDFQILTRFLLEAGTGHFMYRDFQSRNIMLVSGKPWFIDYQGGRKGPLQYDIASLLYDAKASIPESAREILLDYYLDILEHHVAVDRKAFRKYYSGFVLIRILQALGAYGFRGYYENKPHFLKSIPYALANLEYLLKKNSFTLAVPTLRNVLDNIINNSLFRSLKVKSDQLTVKISSFSYKNGIPPDASGNGGGFVFDCRALPNPGRFEEFIPFNGRDQVVISFLEREHEVDVFLNHTFSLVDQSIATYIERGFTSLMINFGCTGGQHRSVYCAEELANHINAKFGVKIDLSHTELDKHIDIRES